VIRFILDTDCAVYAMLGSHPKLRVRLAEREPGDVGVSAISFAEIVLGESRGKPPDMDVINDFVTVVEVLPFDEAAARAYANLPFRRAAFDRLIAAHALSLGATVITNNEADFVDVPGLKIENWTQ
jgi:tRNA(fMet)-specific endonuclease VapC